MAEGDSPFSGQYWGIPNFGKIPLECKEALEGGRLIEAMRYWRIYSNDSLSVAKEKMEFAQRFLKAEAAQSEDNTKMNGIAQALPKEKLLEKLLGMTTSTNDGEALVAIRKANELLSSAGWTWTQLLSGKIVVVEDPFSRIIEPERRTTVAPTAPQRPTPPRPTPPPPRPVRPTPPPNPNPPPRAAPRTFPLSTKTNAYAGGCHCCGYDVGVREGFIASNGTKSNGKTQWAIFCDGCNKNGYFPPVAAKRKYKPLQHPNSKVGLDDL